MERNLYYLIEYYDCRAPLDLDGVCLLVMTSCIMGLLWAAYNVRKVLLINVEGDLIDNELDDGESMQQDSVNP